MHACPGPCSMGGGWVIFRGGLRTSSAIKRGRPYRVQLFMRFMHRACPAHSAAVVKSVRQINSEPKRFMKMQFYFLKTQTHIPTQPHTPMPAPRMPDIRRTLPDRQYESDWIGLGYAGSVGRVVGLTNVAVVQSAMK